MGSRRDTFELFARELLEAKGFKIAEQPDRGADGGRDLIVLEDRKGGFGSTTVRWLVSCKHTIHSGRAVSPKDEANIRDRLETHRCKGFLAFYSHVPTSGLSRTLQALDDPFQYVQYDHERIERELLSDPAGRDVAKRFMPRSFALWAESSQPPDAASAGVLHPVGSSASSERLRLPVKVVNHRRRCADMRADELLPQGSVVEHFDVIPSLHFGTMEYDVNGLNVVVGLKRALCHVTSDHGEVQAEIFGNVGTRPSDPTYNAGDVWEFVGPPGGLLKGYALGQAALCKIKTRPGLPAHAKIELTAARSDIDCSFSPPKVANHATQKVMARFLEKASFQEVSDHLLLSIVEITSP
ncbi:restriction endonuclease [Sphingomonas sp. PP-F2F-A104-K0414]|uniref:restriction endonuclease n=1 Tax=Sphingomonas sp. PP-F2F-A104-K0414 TaxID=2135661 RepID=UPI0010D87E68|nr:restriction endonuclease [Sphingomonas sp. PP-F2F-A104-K0414]TCP96357.1 restriction endonuclease [Sphingomonas sp. PP-F2F-A104-K0414]